MTRSKEPTLSPEIVNKFWTYNYPILYRLWSRWTEILDIQTRSLKNIFKPKTSKLYIFLLKLKRKEAYVNVTYRIIEMPNLLKYLTINILPILDITKDIILWT